MASKIKAATVVLCIAVILGSGVYVVRSYLADQVDRDDARSSRNALDRKRANLIKPDPNGFAPMDVVELQKPITEFEVVSRKQADGWLKDVELVIGVVVDNKPRAYVINTMTGPEREIFNDVLAGRPIAATW